MTWLGTSIDDEDENEVTLHQAAKPFLYFLMPAWFAWLVSLARKFGPLPSTLQSRSIQKVEEEANEL